MKKLSSMRLGLLALLVFGWTSLATPQEGKKPGQSSPGNADTSPHYLSAKFDDLKWERMFPEFGGDSPEIAILRVDPKTEATQLLIWTPKKFSVPRHWHTANETHTVLRGTIVFECEGKRDELGPGSFNYIPSKMIHRAWTSDGSMVFITVDSSWDINWVDGPPQPPKKQ